MNARTTDLTCPLCMARQSNITNQPTVSVPQTLHTEFAQCNTTSSPGSEAVDTWLNKCE